VQLSVKVFSLSTCGTCRRVKELLEKKAVSYDSTDVDLLREEDKAEMIELIRHMNPRLSFPMTLIGDEVIIGFKEAEILKALGLESVKEKGLLSKLWMKITGNSEVSG
jgi:glutaredoxin